MSREVALESNPCLTQTDSLVFFASKKGLMVCDGSSVTCVSEQLRGLNTFLEDAFIAYDYAHSMLWIVKNYNAQGASQPCYVYNLKTGTFSRYIQTQSQFRSMCNIYPNTLLCNLDNTLYSLMDIPQEDIDGNQYNGVIETRPMKLENALALKSIMQVRHICQFSPYTVTETHEDPETHENVETTETQCGTMTLRIFASNNLDNWVELHSLRGTPWKYYRFHFDFANMKATDRFAGTMLITQERRTNKLR
jgi:hypothetical protein